MLKSHEIRHVFTIKAKGIADIEKLQSQKKKVCDQSQDIVQETDA